jgi:hypothetical protein
VQGIVALRGFEDAFHLCRYFGRNALNAIAAVVNKAIKVRCHGITAVLFHATFEVQQSPPQLQLRRATEETRRPTLGQADC